MRTEVLYTTSQICVQFVKFAQRLWFVEQTSGYAG
jgi:hypothetical protein